MKLGNRLSNKICPENMTIEEWQVALRRENARESDFQVDHLDKNRIWGDYLVSSGTGRYRVAFRGVQSDRNFCSCLDFRTNGLGTCKHLEAVTLYLQDHVPGYPWAGLTYTPEYTSIYVSYKGGRSIRVRIGTAYQAEYQRLFAQYFDEEGVLPPSQYIHLESICQQAQAISASFRCYDDVHEFATECLHQEQWKAELRATYPERAIPWNKHTVVEEFSAVEHLLYDLCYEGYGFIVGTKHPFYMHLIARLVEEVYQGEEQREKGYVIVNNETDVLVWQAVLFEYSEYVHLPVQVVSQEQFVKIQIPQGTKSTFVYVHDADCLKEWKNPVSLALKKLEVKHLYMHVDTLNHLTPVQLSSILQHVNPFIIGPFYKFIHTYRPLFPLTEDAELLPLEMKPFTFFATQRIQAAVALPTSGDEQTIRILPVDDERTPEHKVNRLFTLFAEILEDPDATLLLRTKILSLTQPDH